MNALEDPRTPHRIEAGAGAASLRVTSVGTTFGEYQVSFVPIVAAEPRVGRVSGTITYEDRLPGERELKDIVVRGADTVLVELVRDADDAVIARTYTDGEGEFRIEIERPDTSCLVEQGFDDGFVIEH